MKDLTEKVGRQICDLLERCERAALRTGEGLFDRDWEVFVIRHDPETGKYKGSVVCCDAAV